MLNVAKQNPSLTWSQTIHPIYKTQLSIPTLQHTIKQDQTPYKLVKHSSSIYSTAQHTIQNWNIENP